MSPPLPYLGKRFSKIETFGQYPLQVNGYKNLHECLEGAMVEKESESDPSKQTVTYTQEVSVVAFIQLTGSQNRLDSYQLENIEYDVRVQAGVEGMLWNDLTACSV